MKYLTKYARAKLEMRAENIMKFTLIYVLLLPDFTQNWIDSDDYDDDDNDDDNNNNNI
jgi:hypothetical protein